MAWVEALRTAVAIGIALLIVFVIVLCVSSEPLNAIFNFLFGPLTTVRRMGNVVEEMIPIMFTGLSIVILYRTGLFNLSAEGGFFLGAVVAAISAGIVHDELLLDLCYEEDSAAQVDLNCVMTGEGKIVELQGTGEGRAFTIDEQRALVDLCAKGIREVQAIQRSVLGG